jgi:hypothetical protein
VIGQHLTDTVVSGIRRAPVVAQRAMDTASRDRSWPTMTKAAGNGVITTFGRFSSATDRPATPGVISAALPSERRQNAFCVRNYDLQIDAHVVFSVS